MEIDNSKVYSGSWGAVSKSKLADAVVGNAKAVTEMYLFYTDKDKKSTFKFPHHDIRK